MPTFAVIHNGTVSNVIVAEDQASAEEITGNICIEYTEDQSVGIGLKYDTEKGFIFPEPKGLDNA